MSEATVTEIGPLWSRSFSLGVCLFKVSATNSV